MKPNLRLVDRDNGPLILAMLAERESLLRRIAGLNEEIACECRTWSYSRGYLVPLRAEQIKTAMCVGEEARCV